MARNLLDRAIAVVDPVRAAHRERARAQLAVVASLPVPRATEGPHPYGDSGAGGGSALMRWWRPSVRDAVSDTLRALRMQRGQSRELARTSPIAAGAIQTNVDRVVGTGLALVAQPNRAVLGWSEEQALAWKGLVQREFSLWADSTSCDHEGEQTFYEKQGLTLRSALESGDCLTLLPDAEPTREQPYRLRLQTLEADRCGNPLNAMDTAQVAGGVRRAEGGASKAYFVYDEHPGSLLPGRKPVYTGQWVERIGPSGRRRILHHFRQLRPEQPRGVPYLAPIVDQLKQLSRYTEAEIQAAVVSAFFTVFIESPQGPPDPSELLGGTAAANAASDQKIGLSPGMAVGLMPGEKVQMADPSRPNTAFQPFMEGVLQLVGVGLGIPIELLLKKFNASYSASKAALLDAWMFFRGQRAWLTRSFCQPVYETWLAEAVAIGRVPAPGFFADPLVRWAYTRAAWHGDSQGSINPKDEVAAYTAAIDARIMTRERAEWELFGTDWYETFESKAAEQSMLKAADLLPVPKAGTAPAPERDDRQPRRDGDDNSDEESDSEEAFR